MVDDWTMVHNEATPLKIYIKYDDDDSVILPDDSSSPWPSKSAPKFQGRKAIAIASSISAAIFAWLFFSRSLLQLPFIFNNGDGANSPRHGAGTTTKKTTASVAFLGNSMFYFNDFPRFFETISVGKVVQNSCLHGGASIGSLLLEGNLMYPQFQSTKAILMKDYDETGHVVYDYGACTVPQLLLGQDDRLSDPGYPIPPPPPSNATVLMNNIGPREGVISSNPCRADVIYREYSMGRNFLSTSIFSTSNVNKTIKKWEAKTKKSGWDYVLINDNTRNPARASTREHALSMLETFYVPWLLETHSTPIFLWTHAYSPIYSCKVEFVDTTYLRNMTGLEDIANFTSLTGVGYRAYVDLLTKYLPVEQTPRIAPVGLAFLVVHEENYKLWTQLFHCDNLHASPSGSFLQGCIVYYTIFGEMPNKDVVLRHDMASLWNRARMMQHAWEPANPFPDLITATYLYRVAERVMVEGYIPKSYINYTNGEVACEQLDECFAGTHLFTTSV